MSRGCCAVDAGQASRVGLGAAAVVAAGSFSENELRNGAESGRTMKVLAIDYGDRRTGVAISDPSGLIAGETAVLKANGPRSAEQNLLALIAEKQPERVVIGNPLNMDGTAGVRSERSQELAAFLREQTGLRVDLWDERRTTVDAHRILSEAGAHGKKRKETVDAVAATLILEGYLAAMRNGRV